MVASASEIEAKWMTAGLNINAPAEVTIASNHSEINAQWVTNTLTIGSQVNSVCLTTSDFSWLSRDIFAKTGSLGFQQGTDEGHMSVWIKNPDYVLFPNASFIMTLSDSDGSGPRFQFGLTNNEGSGALEGFFEVDDGEGAGGFGTITGQTGDIALDFNAGEWNHFLFGFELDPDPNPLDTGLWHFWINGVEHTVTYSSGSDGKWFGHAQDSTLFRFLTLTADLQGGTASDSFGVCLDEMVLRPTPPDQALADYYFNSGDGVLIEEMDFSPGPDDFSWRFTNHPDAFSPDPDFGDEFWGDSIVPRDTAGFFGVTGATEFADGITGNGSLTPPPPPP